MRLKVESNCLALLMSLVLWFTQLFLIIVMCVQDSKKEHYEKSAEMTSKLQLAKCKKTLLWMDFAMIISAVMKLCIDSKNTFSDSDVPFWIGVELFVLIFFTAKVIVKLFHLEPVVRRCLLSVLTRFKLIER